MTKEDKVNTIKSKLPIISVEQDKNYNRIYLLNGFTFLDRPFNKYLPMTRLVQMIEDNQVVFVDPSTWKDPFEKMYATTDCTSHGYSVRDTYACMCLSYSGNKNEEASWKMYAASSKEGFSGVDAVRINLDKDTFLGLLQDYAEKNDCKVYFGRVIYDLGADEIKALYKTSSPYHDIFCPQQMGIEHFLSLMLLKRGAYRYEDEIRVFIVKNGLKDIKEWDTDKGLLKIKFDYKEHELINLITLAPNDPIDSSVKDYIRRYTNKINKSRSLYNKDMFVKLLGIDKGRVHQCHLYDVQKPIKSLE